jgi:hypothetical protein
MALCSSSTRAHGPDLAPFPLERSGPPISFGLVQRMTHLRSIPGGLPPTDGPNEDLPYSIEVFNAAGGFVELLGRLADLDAARAAFNTSVTKHPHKRIMLRNGDRVIIRSDRPI